jgi:hypothetical protein
VGVDPVSDDIEDQLDEVREDLGELPGGRLIEPLEIWSLTPRGAERALGHGANGEATDMAAMFWSEDVPRTVIPDVVGGWWNDDYMPGRGEGWAPCGAVLPGCVREFTSRGVSWSDVPDDEEMLVQQPGPRTVDVSASIAPCGR